VRIGGETEKVWKGRGKKGEKFFLDEGEEGEVLPNSEGRRV